MTFHLAHIHDYNRFIAIDIGSYRVRASVYSTVDGSLEMLSYASIRQDRKNMIQGSIADMRSVAQTIERAMAQASRDLDNIPGDIILSFSTHTLLSDIITTQYVRADKASMITMDEIDAIIKKIEAESFQRIREKAKKEFGIMQDDVRLVSSTITSISIDGRLFTNPIGSPGTNIRLTILNVFSPASEYNIIRSIVASLGKQTISLIPLPLVLPKILEKSEYISEITCCIDIGYSQTTVLVEGKNEIEAFETFPIGSQLLIDLMISEYPECSPLQIEKLLHDENGESNVRTSIEEFIDYTLDVILGFLRQNFSKGTLTNIMLHGGISQNTYFKEKFFTHFSERYGHTVRYIDCPSIDPHLQELDSSIPYGLAIMAQELLLVKKDPLVRILRYVLYNYE